MFWIRSISLIGLLAIVCDHSWLTKFHSSEPAGNEPEGVGFSISYSEKGRKGGEGKPCGTGKTSVFFCWGCQPAGNSTSGSDIDWVALSFFLPRVLDRLLVKKEKTWESFSCIYGICWAAVAEGNSKVVWPPWSSWTTLHSLFSVSKKSRISCCEIFSGMPVMSTCWGLLGLRSMTIECSGIESFKNLKHTGEGVCFVIKGWEDRGRKKRELSLSS